MAQIQTIRLVDIRRDGASSDTQVREKTDPDTVAQYAEDLRLGQKFPPVSLVADGKGRYYIADGWHRVAAHMALNRLTIKAAIVGSFEGHSAKDSAIRHALKANLDHGLRLSPGDKNKKARAALLMTAMQCLSDRKIAKEIGTSHQTVNRARSKLVQDRRIPHPVTGRLFDDLSPDYYSATQAFNEAFPGGADQFRRTCNYLRKLSADNPAEWCMAVGEVDEDGEEGAVMHSGLIAGKVVSFLPFDNPIVDGLPTERNVTTQAAQSKTTDEQRDYWEQRKRAREYKEAEELLSGSGKQGKSVVSLLATLRESPAKWQAVQTLVRSNPLGTPAEHEDF